MKEPETPKHPVPLIDDALCNGCGLCVRVCMGDVLAIIEGKAMVTNPEVCKYDGHCERVCTRHAITRFFQIISEQGPEA